MTDQPGGDGQPTSYAEKYRGTEWGRPDPSPPPPSSGSRQPLLVALVAVVLIGAVGVGLAAFAMSPDRPSISSLATPSSNPDRVDSGASATSLSPTPTVDPGLAIKAKFRTLASDPAASYHLDGAGRSVFDRATFETFNESLDVVGDEYSDAVAATRERPGSPGRAGSSG